MSEEEMFDEWRNMAEVEQLEILTTCIGHALNDCVSCCIGEQVVAEQRGLA